MIDKFTPIVLASNRSLPRQSLPCNSLSCDHFTRGIMNKGVTLSVYISIVLFAVFAGITSLDDPEIDNYEERYQG